MMDIQWDSPASLMRVTAIETSGDQMEDLVARGTVTELVAMFLEMRPELQRGLMIRAAGPDWVQEFDDGEIRELAGRPGYTEARGAFDTSGTADEADRAEVPDEETLVGAGISGPSTTNAEGRDGER